MNAITRTRRPADSVARVTDAPGTSNARDTHTATFVLGHWEKGALQVLVDALRGEFTLPDTLAFVDTLALEGTTLGETREQVQDSLAHLASLVRGFSQADSVTITASTHDV